MATTTKKPAARKPKAAPKKKIPSRKQTTWRSHGPDALGLGVLFFVVVCVLGLFDAAGPVGRGMAALLQGAVGGTAFAVPIAGVLVAVASFVRREEAGRIVTATTLLIASAAGIAHLANGAPTPSDGWPAMQAAGGLLGALFAVPLMNLVGSWAAALACVFVGILGTLILTKTPLKRAANGAWQATRIALQWLARTIIKIGAAMREKAEKPKPRPSIEIASEHDTRPNLRLVDEGSDEENTIEFDPFAHADETIQMPPVEDETAPVLRLVPKNSPTEDTVEQPQLDLKLPEQPDYVLPKPTLLKSGSGPKGSTRGADEIARILEKTLVEFGVDAAVTGFTRGPTVTQYEIELGAGVKVQKVLSLADDIAYALGSPEVRIISPIPGKSAIGIEVPNRDREMVTVGDVVKSERFNSSKHPLTVALGIDISGAPVIANLAEMPHVLIAGQTGAGKSSCLNSLLVSLLMRARPEDVRLILIDPKMVELTNFDELPHLISPVVTHPKKAAETLAWVVREMERRYDLLRQVGMRNVDFYNEAFASGSMERPPGGAELEHLPYIVVVIDELADLMMVAARSVEDSICRIAQMARAVGIHLVVATQRPSVDVVTGLIKANIPSRIAFAVASLTDSRVILDISGAEKLIGRGDMLYLPTGTSKPLRVQGAFVTESELVAVAKHVRSQAEIEYDAEVYETVTAEVSDDDDGEEEDALLDDAMALVISQQMGSTSMLQRRLKVGFSRAGRLMDLLERKGVVGPQEGSKARAVLITPEEWAHRQFGPGQE